MSLTAAEWAWTLRRLQAVCAEYWHQPYVIRQFTKPDKKVIYERDKGLCHYCRKFVLITEAWFDHYHPWSRGGPTEIENGVIACPSCNMRKSAADRELAPYDVAGLFFRKTAKLALRERDRISMLLAQPAGSGQQVVLHAWLP